MLRYLKSKMDLYRMYETDIWGHIFVFDKQLLKSIFWKKVFKLYRFFKIIVVSSRYWETRHILYIYNYFKKELNLSARLNISESKQYFWIKQLKDLKKKKSYKLKYYISKSANIRKKNIINDLRSSFFLLKSYFLFVKHSQFRKWGFLAKKKEGTFEGNYLLYVEGRIFSVVYRMNVVVNMFMLRNFIIANNVFVNNKLVSYLNYHVKLYQIITFVRPMCFLLRLNLYKRLKQKNFIFLVPRYFIINYALMFGFMWNYPRVNDLVYPIAVDVFRGLRYS